VQEQSRPIIARLRKTAEIAGVKKWRVLESHTNDEADKKM
jgi:hypothetical protein